MSIGPRPSARRCVRTLTLRGPRELHELDLADKHNLLIPPISKLKVYKLDVSIGGHRVALGPQDFLSKDGRVFNATVSEPPGALGDVKLDGQFGINFEIAFGLGQLWKVGLSSTPLAKFQKPQRNLLKNVKRSTATQLQTKVLFLLAPW